MASGRGAPRSGALFQPMLASTSDQVPTGPDWAYEPKYDGIRIVALVAPGAAALVSRNGYDKARQFPEVAGALRALARRRRRNLVLDGEIVALDARGMPSRFEALQGRMQLHDERLVEAASGATPAAFVAFDMLVDGDTLLVDERWAVRRRHLVRTLRGLDRRSAHWLRVSEVALGSPDAMLRDVLARGWEGIMAKRMDGRYEPGRRVRHWQKVKLEHQQEFVVGGWTDPRNSRQHFGALLMGYYDARGRLRFAGHVGSGYSGRTLADVARKLRPICRATSPFADFPEEFIAGAHFVAPKYVAEVRFNEWTSTGMLRHPVFLGLRDDKRAREVVRERDTRPRADAVVREAGPADRPPAGPNVGGRLGALAAFEFTNLDKIFFPVRRITKGRLLQYYADIAPALLPALRDRPLVLKRFPNGITQPAFYQQKALGRIPAGVRVEQVADEGLASERRFIGGDLATLLYIIQLGAISTDPWHSRVQSIAHADYAIVDLDPGPAAPFRRVVQVARWVKEELDELGLRGVPKTSGASGMHIVLPLPAGASYELSRTLAELVARRVNEKHPRETTLHRWVRSRPPAAVYVDYLQNIRGKTVASVYAARAETYASVSTPLKWTELEPDLNPRDFTIDNVVQRVKQVGDLWAAGMRRPNRLPGILGDAAA